MKDSMKKFIGTLQELQDLVSQAGFRGVWSDLPNNQHMFQAKNGAILNWWDTKKKKVTFQGPEKERLELESTLGAIQAGENPRETQTPSPIAVRVAGNNKIFVVHGHDDAAREQLERILLLLGLEPFVLMNTSGEGLTIIEALEKQIGRKPEADFGIVLLTPDDMGYAIKEGENEVKPRARQNVILEMGMLMASLTRSRIAILEKQYVEIPSDADGILRLKFQDHVKEAVPKLTQRLREAGFHIDASRVTKAAS